jgi:hypothetical protein
MDDDIMARWARIFRLTEEYFMKLAAELEQMGGDAGEAMRRRAAPVFAVSIADALEGIAQAVERGDQEEAMKYWRNAFLMFEGFNAALGNKSSTDEGEPQEE